MNDAAGATVPAPAPAVSATRPAIVARASLADAALLGGILCVMLWGVGTYGLYEPHEGHFAGVGREMLTRGDWITPHLNGAPYLNKPPLFYWIIATAYSFFGVSEHVARVPLAIIGWIGVVLAWMWARELWGVKAARTAAAMLTVSAGWYIFAHQLLIDLLLCVLYLASVYLLWKAIIHRNVWRRWAAFYAMVGLSIMSKGLIGLAFPSAVLVLYIVWRKDWKLMKECYPRYGVYVLLAVTMPWLILVEIHNPGSIQYMIINEHLDRIVDKRWPPDYSVAKVNWIGYLITSAIWIAPWSLFMVQIVRYAWKKQDESSGAPARERDAVLLLILAAMLPVLTFLPMPSRLLYYGLPAVPFFVILSAAWWNSGEGDRWGFNAGAITLIVVGIVVGLCGIFLPEKLKTVSELMAAPKVIELIPVISLAISVALLAGGILLLFKRPGLSIAAITFVMSLGCAYTVTGFAAYDDVLSSKRLVESLRPLVGDDCVWISEGSKEIGASAGIAYYLGIDEQGGARTVKILDALDTDGYRAPPKFPGPRPAYLISHQELDKIWSQDKPALFVTDFQRKNWNLDVPKLPSKDANLVQTTHGGNRRVYANSAALKRIEIK